ncbi:hypothetical protein Pmani_009542 [Petrolisthes manimaculis]|uniref:Uncharacterized protein n=1 Tax=Petrolisthes manimaculis TaxID=1843537 RepID=A0AAE1Q6S4_9EUCA|nr:hypothetical protein Pmani_009542 [Petrolisthes manimaculis]
MMMVANAEGVSLSEEKMDEWMDSRQTDTWWERESGMMGGGQTEALYRTMVGEIGGGIETGTEWKENEYEQLRKDISKGGQEKMMMKKKKRQSDI